MLNKLNQFDTNFSSSLSLDSKISSISFQGAKFSKLFDAFLLIIEYWQLLSLSFLFYAQQASTSQMDSPIQFAILYLAKVLNPGYLFTFEEGNNFTWAVLSIVLLYSAFRYTLFVLITIFTQRERELNPNITKIWRSIFKIQVRIGYGFVTSFWLNSIQQGTLEDKLTIFKAEKAVILGVFLTLIVAEFFFCFVLNDRYYSILPTRSLLSSKNTKTENINLTQKFTLQIIQVIFQSLLTSDSSTKIWIFVIVNILFSLFRTTLYFKYLPIYNINGLVYQGILIMILTSFDIATFIQTAAYPGSQDDLNSITTIWVIVSILGIRLAYGYLTRTILKLATQDLRIKPSLLVHKLHIILQLKEQRRVPDDFAMKYEPLFLFNGTVTVNIKNSLESISDRSLNIGYPAESKEYHYHIAVYHLESALAKFPRRNNLIKLYLAKIYGQKLKQCVLAMKYLIELKNSPSKIIAQNASGLIWTLQENMQAESAKNTKKIDVTSYFASKTKVIKFKKNMIKQIDLQDKFYQEIQDENPDLAKISKYAQNIHEYRQEITKDASRALANIPDHYTLPSLLYAQYELLSNNSIARYLKSFKEYNRKSQMFQKYFENEDLLRENCFNERTAVLLVSFQKEDLGKIHFCTKSVSSIYGGDDTMYHGSNISTLAPLNSTPFDVLFSKNQVQKLQTDSLNRPFLGYCSHKSGHIIELNFYIDIFPFLTQGLYYCVFIRQIKPSEDKMLINESGIIQGATKSLMEKLGAKKSLEVGVFARELALINEAFNVAARSNQENLDDSDIVKAGGSQTTILSGQPNQGEQELLSPLSPFKPSKKLEPSSSNVMDLYTIFSAKGRKIKLNKFNEQDNGYSRQQRTKTFIYDCKFATISEGPSVLRLVTLKEDRSHSTEAGRDISENSPSRRTTRNDIQSSTALFFKSKLSNRHDPLEDDLMELVDEKEAGWINFEALTDKNNNKGRPMSPGREDYATHLSGNYITSEGNLISPTSVPLEHRKLMLDKYNSHVVDDEPRKISMLIDNDIKKSAVKPEGKVKVKDRNMFNNSISSKTSNFKLSRVSQSLDAALSSKYYAKPLKVFYIIFYILLLGVLISQITLDSTLDETINDMRVKKEILKNAQLRDYSLVTVYRVYRVILDVATGSFDSTTQPVFPISLNAFVTLVNTTMATLVKTNQNLLLNSGLVDESLRTILFQKDVRIFYKDENGSGYIRNFTTFQATDQIISASYVVLPQSKTNITKAQKSLDFILENAMNDLLIKSEEATDIFLQSIALKVDRGQTTIQVSMIVVLVLLSMAVISLLYFMVKAYVQERINLTALINLDMEHVKDVQRRLNEFRKALIAEAHDDETDILRSYQARNMVRTNKKFNSNRTIQNPNYDGIRKKYLLWTLKALVLLAGVIAIPIISSLLASSSIKSLLVEQSRLYFVNSMSKTINMAYLDYRDLYSTNDSSYIRNEPISNQIVKSINDLSILRNNFLQTFLDDESYSDPVFNRILLGPECSFLVQTTIIDFCGYMKAKQTKLGLVSLLSDYEGFVKEKQERFYTSDRSVETLREIQSESYDIFTATLRLLLDESAMISTRSNLIFENKFKKARAQGQSILVISCVILAVISGLIWITVFNSLREDWNRFKNILRNFPPRLILSNFVIKSFLVKSSNYAADIEKIDL